MKEDIKVFKDLSVSNAVDYVYKYGSFSFYENDFNDVKYTENNI